MARDRCLLFSSVFPPLVGGSAVVYHNICRFNPDRMVVLASRHHYADGTPLDGCAAYDDEAAFPVYRLSHLRPPRTPPRHFADKLWRLLTEDLTIRAKAIAMLGWLCWREKVGIVCIGELLHGGWIAFWAKRVFGCKVINYAHAEEVVVRGAWHDRRRARYLRHIDVMVVVSAFTKQVARDDIGVPEDRLFLLVNGVDAARFSEVRPRPDLVSAYGLADKRVLLSVGRLIERKGFDTLIRALPAIAAALPNIHYLIVGDGPYRAGLETLAAELGVTDRVTFAGYVAEDDLADHYGLCDLFVLPNREMPDGDNEGFGLVYLEANAAGKPVISGRAGGVLDAVSDGENGLTVDGTDPDAVSQAVIRVLTDADLYARLARGGQEAAHAATWQERAKLFARLCETLTAS